MALTSTGNCRINMSVVLAVPVIPLPVSGVIPSGLGQEDAATAVRFNP